MKPLALEAILTSMGIKPDKAHQGVSISNVTHNKFYPGNHTLYFRRSGRIFLDGEKFKKFTSFYIVTDSSFSNMDKLRPEQIIMVDDVMKAFFTFTSYYRHLFDIPVVAITGTCGKTTTKEMLKHILQKDYKVQATVSNKNAGCYNLPYLMGIDEETDAAIIEAAVAEPGHMMETCKYFFPTIGVMTMIDVDHTDHFRSFREYVREKEKLIRGLNNKGTLIINADDPHILSMDFSKYRGKLITFGKDKKADWRIKDMYSHKNKTYFKVNYRGKSYTGSVPGLGEHNVYNAVASIATAREMGMKVTSAIKRLASFEHLSSHFEIIEGRNKTVLIDDTWKSNPASLKSGLLSLVDMARSSQRTIAVLGRMAELGIYADEEYKKIGQLLKEIGIDVLITKGFFAKDIAKSAIRAGMKKDNIYHFSEEEEMKSFLDTFLQPNDIVYFKTDDTDHVFDRIIRHLKR
ncbi:UDP-N-acetylmuramoyl-tripeptide--D-alanyl-D-alanine ligase [Pseudobacillus sp. FSL P4-0506]|uniref:UDP-N-acetylmuramoyl-tripeptide--D-alanyl-D- alanine ligase n=1 Tax=Pseudobacillus sp. FSL P4-0506 TaxID=2921576 RepID=UPI0030F53B0F